MELIVAVAIKDLETGKIYVGRHAHMELVMMFPEIYKKCEEGFLTSKDRFVDRKEALKIAKKYNQIVKKHGLDTELYSEDVFLDEDTVKRIEIIREHFKSISEKELNKNLKKCGVEDD